MEPSDYYEGGCKLSDPRKESSKHPTEVKFPEQARRFKELTEGMYQTHLEKNQDYSPSNVLLTGMGGVLVRMWDKLSRIYNLMGVPMPHAVVQIKEAEALCLRLVSKHPMNNTEVVVDSENLISEAFQKIYDAQQVDFSGLKEARDVNAVNEPLEDSLKDLSNYAIIAMILAERKWGR